MDRDYNSGLNAAVLRLREEMNSIADDVSTGMCASFEDYKYLVGIINGLARAERIILDIAQKQSDVDE